MLRRSFLKALAALPVVGKLVKAEEPKPTEWDELCDDTFVAAPGKPVYYDAANNVLVHEPAPVVVRRSPMIRFYAD
jgi:hypothetical protein